jgi:P4 family phage/plasmid primase-like protien
MSTGQKTSTLAMIKESKALGYSPMPITGKRPILENWTMLTDDELEKSLKTHNGNIAIRTGQLSDIIIIDCDLPRNNNGKDGNIVWEELVNKYEGIKASELKTPIDKSGSGGFRYYFKWKQMSYKKNITIDGLKTLIDVLSDGQCAVYPGSIYPGCCTDSKKDDKTKHKCDFNGKCQFQGAKYKWIRHPFDGILQIPFWLEKLIKSEEQTIPLYKQNKIKTKNLTNDNVQRIEKYMSLLKPTDWDEICYADWVKIVWTLLSIGMDEGDIHKWCALGKEKYTSESTDAVIKSWNQEVPWACGPTSFIMKWIRSCLYKHGHTNEEVLEMMLEAVGETYTDVITKNLTYVNANFKGFTKIYYELYAQTNIVTIDSIHPFYIWSEEKKLWTHFENQKMASSKLYTDFSNFMETLLTPYTLIEERSEFYREIIATINKKRNFNELEGNLLYLCEDSSFLNLINNVKENTFAYDLKIIDLKTGTSRTRIRTDYYTKTIPLTPSNYGYPKITKFINSLWDGQEERHYAQKLCGYFLTASIIDRSMYIWTGEGMNGKSVLVKLIRKVLGHHAVTASRNVVLEVRDNHNGPTPELIHLMGSRLAILPETKNGDRLNDQQIKELVSGDTICARALYSSVTEFDPKMKLLLMTNFKPKFDSTDIAMVDRIKLLTFPKRFEKTTETMNYVNDLIENYGNEMFSFMIDGAKMFYSEGLKETELMKQDKQTYCKEENSFTKFLIDKCNIATDHKILRSDFLNSYKNYCAINKLTCKQYKWIKDNNYIKDHRFANGWYVIGYSMKEDDD